MFARFQSGAITTSVANVPLRKNTSTGGAHLIYFLLRVLGAAMITGRPISVAGDAPLGRVLAGTPIFGVKALLGQKPGERLAADISASIAMLVFLGDPRHALGHRLGVLPVSIGMRRSFQAPSSQAPGPAQWLQAQDDIGRAR